MGLGELIADMAERYPKKLALIHGTKQLKYKELDQRTNRLANAFLHELKLKKGDHVGILLYNCIPYVEIYVASYKFGGAAFGINYRYRENEVTYIVNQSKAKVFIIGEEFLHLVNNCKDKFEFVEKIIVISEDLNKYQSEYPDLISDALDYEELIARHPDTKPELPEPLQDGDKAFLIYTGGTTGLPKGAIWVHGAIENLYRGGGLSGFLELFKNIFERLHDLKGKLKRKNYKQLLPIPISWFRFLPMPKSFGNRIIKKISAKDPTKTETKQGWISRSVQSRIKTMMHAPMFHFKGWLISNLPLFSGSTVVIASSKTFNPKEVLETLEKEGCNVFCTIGDKTVRDIIDVLKTDETLDPEKISKNLLIILSGAAPFSAASKQLWWDFFPNTMICDTVGQTEAVILPTIYVPGDELKSNQFDYLRDKIKIVDPATGEEVNPGEEGEGWFKMDALPTMKEYFGDKSKTAKTIKDGWLHSGDLYQVAEDGVHILLIGRIKETIVTGGEKIHPPEVEEVLNTHPSVYESVILGVPDPQWGYSVLGLIKLKNPEDASSELKEELIDYCKERMASYKKPRFIEFVKKFPSSPAGKIKRAELREKYKGYVETHV
ncbi:MAG: acyl--CoA ligase [Candidatus Helarchaeota archaeon]|nr:acyl--CoA ligase [Candidatus Helarchaeota archaeon]